MARTEFRPGNMVYPLPAALVSCADAKGNTNLITVAWTGTICSDPAMLYISVRPERHSHHMLEETGEFVLNLTTEEIIRATDMCGVRSGRDVDKWKLTGLTPEKASKVRAPLVKESPVCIECRIVEKKKLGSHDMYIAEVLCIDADRKYINKSGRLELNRTGLIVYSHGEYFTLGQKVGSFGYSVKKDPVYAAALEKKQKYISELFKDTAEPEPIEGMADPGHYRNKVHHVFSYDRKKGIISGSYEEGTHKVVNEEDNPINDLECQEIIRTIRGLCKSFKIKAYDEDTGYGLLRHVLVRRGFKTGEIMVVLVLASKILPGKNNFVRALLERHPEITTIVLNVNSRKTSVMLGDFEKTLYGPGFIKDELCGLTFRISPKSFYQVNPVQCEKLYGIALDYAELTENDTVLDAYCGIGTIGLCAAEKAGKVIGVELSEDAVRDAKFNAKENGIKNADFICGDASEWISEYGRKADVVFMDPPRAGSTRKFIKAAAGMNSDRIVYISCNPETLARDVGIFGTYGYHVRRLRAVDMFPFTENVEVVCLLGKG